MYSIHSTRSIHATRMIICELFAQITRESLMLLFFKEVIAHGGSFVKTDMSKLLTVTLL